MSTLADGVRLAWGTLTAIPGPAPARVDAGVARVAMSIGWLVVLPLTMAASAAGWGLALLGVPPLASGLATVGLLHLATRAIHADGLADTADGLGSGRDRERALAIMRRGDVGPMGVTALVLVIGMQAALLGDLLGRPGGWPLAGLALAGGRLALANASSRHVPAARPDGLGVAMAGSVPLWQATAVSVLVFGLGMVATALLGQGPGGPAFPSWSWPLAMVLGTGLSGLVLVGAIRRLGGITGDVLGALVEVMALGLLLGLSVR